MTVNTFERGVFLPHYKEYSEHEPITAIALPQEVVIPLRQHIGAPCQAIVKAGDTVKIGQKIGDSDAFVSAAVFSSVDGKVVAVEPRPNFTGEDVESVVIEVASNQEEPTWKDRDIEAMGSEEIKTAIKDAGIVGMGGAAFPTHVKLSPPKPIDVIIINACECEPFLTCDHRVILEMTEAMVKGAKLIAKTVDASRIVFGIETNKPDGIEALKEAAGDDEMIEAVRKISEKYNSAKEITAETIKNNLMTKDLPPVDLLIRTGGEPHLSVGFMMWDIANAQLYFLEKLYPDFTEDDFEKAVREFQKRERRLGK